MNTTITQIENEIFEIGQQIILFEDVDPQVKKDVQNELLDKIELLTYQKLELEFGGLEN